MFGLGMTETIIIKMVLGIVLSGFFAINIKIIWQYLDKGSSNKKDIIEVQKILTKIQPQIDNLCKAMNLNTPRGVRTSLTEN